MLNILIKKQLTEIFRSYFYDSKKNKARSKGSTIACFVGFSLLMIVVIGGMFTAFSLSICAPMAQAKVDWLYFALTGLVAIAMGAFGSVFNTYSGLYLAKDNDQLLSLPIPVSAIIAARLMGVYLMGLMYSAMVSIPAAIVYWVKVSCSAAAIVGSVVFVLVISVIALLLSCALGWVVAKISLKLKNKSFVTVAVSILFISVYYYVYFNASSMISKLLTNAAGYAEKIKGAAYPVYIFGKMGTGDIKAALLSVLVTAVLCAVMWKIISSGFIKIATATGKTEKKIYKSTRIEQKSISQALFSKELARFTASPNYMLNCGMGILLMPVGAVAFLIKGKTFFSVLNEITVDYMGFDGAPLILLCAIICLLASMNDMASPSVSLEGKNIWLLQSLPVTAKQALDAKISVQLVLTSIPVLICVVCVAAVCRISVWEVLAFALLCAAYVLFMGIWDIFWGLKIPNLNWTNEISPIKQSMAVLIALFGGFIFSGAIPLIYFKGGFALGFVLYALIYAAVLLAASAFIYRWIKTKGAKIFAEL